MKRGKKEFHNHDDVEIPLILESYQDIFSSFDPRDYSDKAISKDFLLECKNASMDKEKKIKLNLFLPKNKRALITEEKIKRRLKEHFKKHFLEKKRELINLISIGIGWFIAGCFLIVLTAFLIEKETSFLVNVLVNVAHPGGWFFLWEGLAKVLIHSKENKEDYWFNKKMKEAKISFFS